MKNRRSVARQILDLHRCISPLSDEELLRNSNVEAAALYRWLDRLAVAEIDEATVEALLADPSLTEGLSSLARLRSVFGLRLEYEVADQVLQAPSPWSVLESLDWLANYQNLVHREWTGIGLEKGDRVAFLGCGPLPLTVILLAKRGAQCIGLEREATRADLARRVIHRLALPIEIVTGDHNGLPLSRELDLFMVAAAAEPRDEIFGVLARVLPVGSAVTFRMNEKGARKLLGRRPPTLPPPGFKLRRRLPPEPPAVNTVVVLERAAPDS